MQQAALGVPADEIVAIADRALIIKELATGSLDKRIAELKALNAEVTEKQRAITSLDDARKTRKEAEDYASRVKAEAQRLEDAAMGILKDAEKKHAEAVQRVEDAVRKQKDAEAANVAAAEARKKDELLRKEAHDQLAARRAELDQLAARVTADQASLRAAQAAVASERAELQKQREKIEAKAKLLLAD